MMWKCWVFENDSTAELCKKWVVFTVGRLSIRLSILVQTTFSGYIYNG